MSRHCVIHIVRHAETATYGHDAGLTAIGHGQAAGRGWQLGSACNPGESVEFAYAPTERARETAIDLRASFAEASCGLDPSPVLGTVAVDRGFRNSQVLVDGEKLEPTAARSLLLHETADGRALPGWMTEAAYQFLFLYAVTAAGPGLAAALTLGVAPVATGLCSWAWQRERPNVAWCLSTAVCIVGTVLLLSGSLTGQHVRPLEWLLPWAPDSATASTRLRRKWLPPVAST